MIPIALALRSPSPGDANRRWRPGDVVTPAAAGGGRGFRSLSGARLRPHMASRAAFFSQNEIFGQPASSQHLGHNPKPQHSLLNWTGSERARSIALRSWRIYFLDVVRGEGGLNPQRVLARTGALAAQMSPRKSGKLLFGVPHSRYAELLPMGSSFFKKRREIRGGGVGRRPIGT
jgi:hypothetical protein